MSHESGGADPLDLTNIHGELPDPQKAKSHAANHQSGGADQISVQGLSGILADPQPPSAHTHSNVGSNKIYLTELTFVLTDPDVGSPFTIPAPDIDRFDPESASVTSLVTVNVAKFPSTFSCTPIFSYTSTLQADNSVEVRLYDMDGYEIDASAGWDGAEVKIRVLLTAL